MAGPTVPASTWACAAGCVTSTRPGVVTGATEGSVTVPSPGGISAKRRRSSAATWGAETSPLTETTVRPAR